MGTVTNVLKDHIIMDLFVWLFCRQHKLHSNKFKFNLQLLINHKYLYLKELNGFCVQNNNNFLCHMRYAYINGDGCCVCPIGMAFNMNYECVQINRNVQCPIGGFIQPDGTCICISPFVNNAGACIICPNGFFWNGLACVLSCPIDRVFDPSTVSCVCLPGYIQGLLSNCIRC